MNLKQLRKKCTELKREDREIYEIASSIPQCEGTGSWKDDEREYLEGVIEMFEDIKTLIKKRCELNGTDNLYSDKFDSMEKYAIQFLIKFLKEVDYKELDKCNYLPNIEGVVERYIIKNS